ncbi:GMC oxidoreductase domain-containing protein [Sarocladium implicatum]|nr:GMC oxidoreductase domain-containing protein [Sarocladium implicatum]
MRKYFKKLEKNEYLQSLPAATGHGYDGWLPTRLTPTSLIARGLKIISLLMAASTATGKGAITSLLGTVTGFVEVLTLNVNTDAKNRDKDDLIYQMSLFMNSKSVRTGPRDFVLDVATAESSDGSRKHKLDIALNTLDGDFQRIWPPTNISTPDQWRQFARDEAWGHHASCTAPISADDDPMAVLDSKFRVRSVDGLRVVDASAFPKIPGLFVALPTFTMSEKAADVIIEDAKSKKRL